MSDRETVALLKEALEFLNDHPSFGLRRDPRRTTYGLASRIDGHLGKLAGDPHPAIAEARERWSPTSFIRIDPDERCIETTAAGSFWVRAWVCVAPFELGEHESALRMRYQGAIAALPDETRRVFLAHRIEGLPYPAIAERLKIEVGAVERHIARALVSIADYLDNS